MIFSHLLTGSVLCFLTLFVEGRRGRRFEDVFDENALANENAPPPIQANDTEPRSKVEFIPYGFANISEYATALSCGSQNTLSPGSSFLIQSPNFLPIAATQKYQVSSELFLTIGKCNWQFNLPERAQVDLICDFFNAPCAFRNFLILAIQGSRSISYCNRNSDQILRNQRVASLTNTGDARTVTISFVIPRFRSRSGQGVQCRVIALGSLGPNPTTSTVASVSTTVSPITSTVSPVGCGIKNQGRIVGGNEATPNEWPWAVFITIQTNAGGLFCGGSVITNEAVLTAAHCVEGSVQSVSVHFGCHRAVAFDCDRVITVPAQNVISHPSYRSVGSGRDVAVIRLTETLTFTNTIRPVCLPTSANNNFADNSLWVAGWGRVRTGGSTSSVLKEATLDHIPLSSCRQVFGNIASDILCNRRGSGDTCQGDSGSGVTNFRSGRYFVDGVVSFGRFSCEAEPSGNAEVFDNLNFIQQNI